VENQEEGIDEFTAVWSGQRQELRYTPTGKRHLPQGPTTAQPSQAHGQGREASRMVYSQEWVAQ
jgi:hypothetical protein